MVLHGLQIECADGSGLGRFAALTATPCWRNLSGDRKTTFPEVWKTSFGTGVGKNPGRKEVEKTRPEEQRNPQPPVQSIVCAQTPPLPPQRCASFRLTPVARLPGAHRIDPPSRCLVPRFAMFDSKVFRDFDHAVLRELLYPRCWSSNVTNPPASSQYCCSSSSGHINFHLQYCSVNLGVFADVNSKQSLSIETAPSPADVETLKLCLS